MLSVDVQTNPVGHPRQVDDAVAGGAGIDGDLREKDAGQQQDGDQYHCRPDDLGPGVDVVEDAEPGGVVDHVEEEGGGEEGAGLVQGLVDRAHCPTVRELAALVEGELQYEENVVQEVDQEKYCQEGVGKAATLKVREDVEAIAENADKDDEREENDPDHVGVTV